MQNTGERQVGKTLEEIKPDHIQRYFWARDMVFSIDNDLQGVANILDGACGGGYGSYVLSQTGKQVIGVDNSLEAIQHCDDHYSAENIDYIHMDLFEYLHLADYDEKSIIVSFETIEHVEEAEELVKAFADTSPFLIASVPNQEVLPFDKEKFPFHTRHYTNQEFRELLEGAGYIVKDIWTQYDKHQGILYNADDGRTLIYVAVKK